MQESAESLSVPLVFLRPIGIAAADAMRLMEAAKRLDGLVRWRLAPAGVAADVYMAHASRVRYPDGMEMPSAPPDTAAGALMPHEDPATDSAPMPLASLADSVRSFGASLSSLGMSRGPYNSTGSGMSGSKPMQLDQHGWYKDHPVCVLGSHTDPLITDQLGDMQALRFPAALHQMISQLRRIESEIIGIRMLYQLGRMSWEHRQSWREHRLHLHHGSRLIAVIDGSRWQAHILESCHVDELEAAQVMRAPRAFTACPWSLRSGSWPSAAPNVSSPRSCLRII
jgi:hypothetical protein